jgi:hypothetical protein
MTWMEVYQMIQNMKQKLDQRGYATKVFSRGNYHDVLCVLSNDKVSGDRSIDVKVNMQDGILTVRLRRKKEK